MFNRVPLEIVMDVLCCGVLSCADVVRAAGICRRVQTIVYDQDATWARLARLWRIVPHDATLESALRQRCSRDESQVWATVHTWRELVWLHQLTARQMGRDLGQTTTRSIPYPEVQHLLPFGLPSNAFILGMNVVPHLNLLVFWTLQSILTYDLTTCERRWSYRWPCEFNDPQATTYHVLKAQADGDYIVVNVQVDRSRLQVTEEFYVFHHDPTVPSAASWEDHATKAEATEEATEGSNESTTTATNEQPPNDKSTISIEHSDATGPSVDDIGLPTSKNSSASLLTIEDLPPSLPPATGRYRFLGILPRRTGLPRWMTYQVIAPYCSHLESENVVTLYDLRTLKQVSSTTLDLDLEGQARARRDRRNQNNRKPHNHLNPHRNHILIAPHDHNANELNRQGPLNQPPRMNAPPRVISYHLSTERREVYALTNEIFIGGSYSEVALCSDLDTGKYKWCVPYRSRCCLGGFQPPHNGQLERQGLEINFASPYCVQRNASSTDKLTPSGSGTLHGNEFQARFGTATAPPVPTCPNATGNARTLAVQGNTRQVPYSSTCATNQGWLSWDRYAVSHDTETGAVLFHMGVTMLLVTRFPKPAATAQPLTPNPSEPSYRYRQNVCPCSDCTEPQRALYGRTQGPEVVDSGSIHQAKQDGETDKESQERHDDFQDLVAVSIKFEVPPTNARSDSYPTVPISMAQSGRVLFSSPRTGPLLIDYSHAQSPDDLRAITLLTPQLPSPYEIQRQAVFQGPKTTNGFYDRRLTRTMHHHPEELNNSDITDTERYLGTQTAWLRRVRERRAMYAGGSGWLTSSTAYILGNADRYLHDQTHQSVDFVRCWDLSTSALLRLAPQKAATILGKRRLTPCPERNQPFQGERPTKRAVTRRGGRVTRSQTAHTRTLHE